MTHLTTDKPEVGKPVMKTEGPVRVPSEPEIRAAATAFVEIAFADCEPISEQVVLDAMLHALLAADKVRGQS